MARKKVKLAYITNESARKATFKKRKSGLMKKVWELSELCGIDACAIILNPYDSQFEVSPSPNEVRRILEKFANMSEMEQTKKMVNQESFLRERIIKAREQLNKKSKENRNMEMTNFMFRLIHTGAGQLLQCSNMGVLNRLQWLIDNNLKGIRNILEPYENNVNGTTALVAHLSTPTPPQPLAPATTPGSILKNSYSQLGKILIDQKPMTLDFGMNMQNRQWPMDTLNAQGHAGTSTGMNMQNRQWPVNMLNAQGHAGTSTGTGMNMQNRQWPMNMLNAQGHAGTSTGTGMNMQNQQWPMDMLNAQGQTGTGMGMATGTGTRTETWLQPGEDMVLPFEQNPNAFWSKNGYCAH